MLLIFVCDDLQSKEFRIDSMVFLPATMHAFRICNFILICALILKASLVRSIEHFPRCLKLSFI